MGELLTLALHNSPSGTETQKLCFACESSDVDPFGLSGNGLHLLLTSARQRAQLTRMLHDRVLKFRKKRADLGDGFGKTNRKNVIGTILGRIANVFGFSPKSFQTFICILLYSPKLLRMVFPKTLLPNSTFHFMYITPLTSLTSPTSSASTSST